MNKSVLVLLGLLSVATVANASHGARNWINENLHTGRFGGKEAVATSSSKAPVTTTNTSNASNATNSTKYYLKPFTSTGLGQLPTTQITVGNQTVTVTVDLESPTDVILTGSANQYSYVNSTTSSQLDVFRYRDGSNQAIGYYINDQICNYQSDGTFKNWTQVCGYGDFLAASFNVSAYGSNQGSIGLGMGTPKYGNAALANIKVNTNGKVNSVWSYSSSVFTQVGNSLLIGGPQTARIQNNTYTYNVSSNSTWTLNLTGLGISKSAGLASQVTTLTNISGVVQNIFNATEDSLVHLEPFSSQILFPNKTYANLTATFQKQVSGLVCNASGCFSNNLCSSIIANVSDITLRFTDTIVYVISAKNFLYDTDPFSCQFLIGSQGKTTQTQIGLGAPFFEGFQGIFDPENRQVGFALETNAFSSWATWA